MIDRRAVVGRHHPTQCAPDARSPLAVGNGEFAFTVDATGLQSFPDWHTMQLGTQAQWGFHEMPNPDGYVLDDVMAPYATPTRTVDYPVRYDFNRAREDLADDEHAGYFFWVNPQRLHLGHLGLRLRHTPEDEPTHDIADLSAAEQTLDLWEGRIDSRFGFAHETTEVQTVCHPDRDLVAVRIRSPLLADGRATVTLRFPYASDTFCETVDWTRPDAHQTAWEQPEPGLLLITRVLDDTRYHARVGWTGPGTVIENDTHDLELRFEQAEVELTLEFTREIGREAVPSFDTVVRAAADHWETFWSTGAAVDFAGSTDPRAAELERRVVLSQYLTAIHCAGSTPPQESGLVVNSWAGKFHLEMHYWHAAHFPVWSRPELLERSLAWYRGILPVAQETARAQGYAGARWPKHVGPEGRESPNVIGPLLVWQQPHPIHYAELLRLGRPDDQELVERYAEIVDESASFIASFLHWDDGTAHLAPPLVPAQEDYDPTTVWDPTFELAYCWWALDVAQDWRVRRGLARDDGWDRVLEHLAAPSVTNGIYDAVAGPPGSGEPGRTTRHDHPSLLGALGLVPQTPLIDPDTMRRTLEAVLGDWDWVSAWGWDFPMMAMCATRLGDGHSAVDALLRPAAKNTYLPNGHNLQVAGRLPLYLPGNGGLLMAVALMVSGWDGCTTEQPGIPDDGTWTVVAEGFAARP